jgi:hypothetical protein
MELQTIRPAGQHSSAIHVSFGGATQYGGAHVPIIRRRKNAVKYSKPLICRRRQKLFFLVVGRGRSFALALQSVQYTLRAKTKILGHMLGDSTLTSFCNAVLLHVSGLRREHRQQAFEGARPVLSCINVSVMLQCMEALCCSSPINGRH